MTLNSNNNSSDLGGIQAFAEARKSLPNGLHVVEKVNHGPKIDNVVSYGNQFQPYGDDLAGPRGDQPQINEDLQSDL